ncbi:MAG: TonB-linked SusC/RagA family outer membrane protein [Cyclobacteriaceae bacterium]|jgi:TonB-linked SusC/RagA family outer membrane protein
MKRILLLSISFLFVFGTAWAQRTVSGRVTSESDNGGVPGVNVILKGTTTGATTDLDGNYRVSVPEEGGTLVFSFIGLATQEVEIGARSIVDVAMNEDVETLSEVVVTALGVERSKAALGYSVSTLSSDQIAKRSEPDAIRSLTSKVPGVNIQGGGGAPGQSTRINIRGYASMTGNTQPLFVVDGVPFDNSVTETDNFSQNTVVSNRAFDIDPNNIENVTVLKGAAAAALYGSRASNGVILITTKANRRSSNKGLEVRFSSSYSVEQIAGLPNYQDVYMQGSNQVYNGGFIGNWGQPFPAEVDRINAEYGTNYTQSVVGSSLSEYYPDGWAPHPLTGIGRNFGQQQFLPDLMLRDGWSFQGDNFVNGTGDILPWPDNPGVNLAVPVRLQPHDNVGGFFQDGSLFENALNITSTSERASVNFTLSRTENTGVVPNSSVGRTAIGFGINTTLQNGLYVQGSINYVNTTQAAPPTGASYNSDYGGGSGGSIFSRLFYLPRNFNLNEYPYKNPVNGDNIFYRALDNPRWLTENNKYTSDVNRVYGNVTFTYDITDWLTATAKGGFNQYTDSRRDFREKGGVAFPFGFSASDILQNREIDANFILTATKDINSDINMRLTVGHNVNERRFERYSAVGQNLVVRGIGRSNNSLTQTTFEQTRLQRFYAFYADYSVSFRDFFFLNLMGRNDISSTLPEANRSYFYPSVSTSFIFTDAFNISSNILNYGKLRIGYAQVGNEALPYRLQTVFGVQQAFNGLNRVSLGNRLNNLNLQNELTSEIEIGVDTRLFNDKITADITWFKKNSFDQIVSADVAASSGFSRSVINSGEIQNSGWEVGINATPVSLSNGFEWNVGIAFTKIVSEIIFSGEGGDIIVSGAGSTAGDPVSVIHRTGEQYGQIYGTRIARDDAGNMLIDRALGTPITDDGSHIIGNPNPDFVLGVTNSLRFKGFTLNALFDWKQGGDMVSYTAASLKLRGQLAYSVDREAVRVVPGVYGDRSSLDPILGEDGAAIQNTTGISSFDWYFSNGFAAYGATEVNVYDATIVRLRELSLGYDFPKTLLSKTPFGSANISLSGRNLWYNAPNFPEDLNFDPEVLGSTSASNLQGFDLGATPTTRRFGVNLSVTF